MTTQHQHTVLYIEDDPASKKLLQQFLLAYPGINFITAWSAEEGIVLARQHQPELIFLDIMLPCMDGREAVQKLRQEAVAGDTPIYAISADAIPANIDRAMACGFNGYITKPVNLQAIRDIVDSTLLKP